MRERARVFRPENARPRGSPAGCTTRVGFFAYTAAGAPVGPRHTITLRLDGVAHSTPTVTIKDWLIAAIGDSYGSGEGNPDVVKVERALRRDKPSLWEDKQCHRSASAAASQIATRVHAGDPKNSVTLVHLSCSGAQIDHGIVKPYKGAAPDAAKTDKKASQLGELSRKLGKRKPDALLVSIGGNDIGFSDIITNCLKYRACDQGAEKCLPRAAWPSLKVFLGRALKLRTCCGESARALFKQR